MQFHIDNYIAKLSEHAINGAKEFAARPVQHMKNFVKDYWDLGVVVLSGIAFHDIGNETFGAARGYLIAAGPIAGMIGGGACDTPDRVCRNLYAGLATVTALWTRGIDAPMSAEIGNYAVAGLSGAASVYMDRCRKHYNQRKALQTHTVSSLDAVLK